jgi:hypothetical protein
MEKLSERSAGQPLSPKASNSNGTTWRDKLRFIGSRY